MEEKKISELEDEIIVFVNFEEPVEGYSKECLLNAKILGLDSEEPILQVGKEVFGGSWNETVGTAIFFEEAASVPKKCYFSDNVPKPMQYSISTTKSLNLKRVFISEKPNSVESEEVFNGTDSSDVDDQQSNDR